MQFSNPLKQKSGVSHKLITRQKRLNQMYYTLLIRKKNKNKKEIYQKNKHSRAENKKKKILHTAQDKTPAWYRL